MDYETKINTWSIAKKANVPESEIIKVLERLKKDEIITYSSQHNDIEIIFLVPREDDRTINMFAKKVEVLLSQKTKHIDAILSYIKNDTICRSQQLLTYFGEKKSNCGKCDICLKTPVIKDEVLELVKEAILQQLEKKPLSSRELIKIILYKKASIFSALQALLENEMIEITATNKYKVV